MPPTRSKAAGKHDATSKRTVAVGQKRTVEQAELTQRFLCPISQKLPVDPVTAEDGHTYDKGPLQEWFAQHPGTHCRSPLTNEPMAKKFVPAYAVRSALELLVEQGIVADDALGEWKEQIDKREKERRCFQILMGEATQGTKPDAMFAIGLAYRDGAGVEKDDAKATEWFTKASRLGHATATAALGVRYLQDCDAQPAEPARGMLELARAAMLGSEHAACVLAWSLSLGLHDLKCDHKAAIWWFKQSLACAHKGLNKDLKEARDMALAAYPA